MQNNAQDFFKFLSWNVRVLALALFTMGAGKTGFKVMCFCDLQVTSLRDACEQTETASLPKIGGHHLLIGRSCLAQSGHTYFIHESPEYTYISFYSPLKRTHPFQCVFGCTNSCTTSEMRRNHWITFCRKKKLIRKFWVFVRHSFVSHVRYERNKHHALKYLKYVTSNEADLNPLLHLRASLRLNTWLDCVNYMLEK